MKNAVKCDLFFLNLVTIQLSTSQGTTCGGISDYTVIFLSSFLVFLFHFTSSLFSVNFFRAFGYDPQERFFSSAFLLGRSGHRGPSRFFLADCSLRTFVRAGLGNMLFRRARWVVVTARL